MIIYTVITNAYDTLKEPKVVTPGWRYVCFSDAPIQSKVWEFIEIENTPGIDRRIKIRAHDYFDSKVNIYVDGSFLIIGNLNDFISKIETTFSLSLHRRCDCIYEEAEALLNKNMIDPLVWKSQKERYQLEGFPEELGMGRNGILIRDLSDPEVLDINERWWNEYVSGVKRDQLSLMYCFWKVGRRPNLQPPIEFRNYFKLKKHNVHRG